MHDSDSILFPASHEADVLPFDANTDDRVTPVKHRHEPKPLTLGSCIASVCEALGPERAEGFLRFAVNSGIVVFPEWRPVEIAPRDPRMVGRPNDYQSTGLFRYFLPDSRDQSPAVPRLRHLRVPAAALRFADRSGEGPGNVAREMMQACGSREG